MWWIAACLGALVWLLSIRIKLKDQQRHGRTRRWFDRDRPSPKLEREGDAKRREDFIHKGFLPAAELYLREEPNIQSVLLLLACFSDDGDGPPSVHGEVLPCFQSEPLWPGAASYSPVVQGEDGELVMVPGQRHWEHLASLEAWRDSLPAFAPCLIPVPPSSAFVHAYRPYAVVRRAESGFELNILESVGN